MSDMVEISKQDILDVLVCAEDYGYDKPIIMSSLVKWHGPISKTEIEAFATSFLDDEAYGEEDVENANTNITEIFERYGRVINA